MPESRRTAWRAAQDTGGLGATARTKQERSAQIAIGVANDDPAALRARIAELEKQLRRTEMEREILKKFSQYATTQMPGGLP